MSLKEKIKIILRSARLIEKADKGIFRRNLIAELPSIIQTFSGIFLASLVIDGVTGGKPVSYLITAAATVCVIELISNIIRHISNRNYNVHDVIFYRNIERFIREKVLNMDYARVEDITTLNKLSEARTYATNSNTALPSLINFCTNALSGIIEIIIAFVLAAPVLFMPSGEITDIKTFFLSGWGTAVVFVICGASNFIQSLIFIPKSEKYMAELYTNTESLQADRERSFFSCSHDLQLPQR